MLTYMYHTLGSFRSVFSRHHTWLLFVMGVLGFIGATHIDGVSSFCRVWSLQTPGYLALLHLFRSSAWSLTELLSCWGAFVLRQHHTVTVDGRAVLLGDHTMTAKDGRRMPGVVTLHQDSATQSKPHYFRDHYLGAIGLLFVCTHERSRVRCVPGAVDGWTPRTMCFKIPIRPRTMCFKIPIRKGIREAYCFKAYGWLLNNLGRASRSFIFIRPPSIHAGIGLLAIKFKILSESVFFPLLIFAVFAAASPRGSVAKSIVQVEQSFA
jgi:hypothetical protein